MRGDPSLLEAESVAEGLLAPLRSRWRHTQAVAARAAGLPLVMEKVPEGV
jgi:hypothetical protein